MPSPFAQAAIQPRAPEARILFLESFSVPASLVLTQSQDPCRNIFPFWLQQETKIRTGKKRKGTRREHEREQREDGMEEKAKNTEIRRRKGKRLGRSLRSPPLHHLQGSVYTQDSQPQPLPNLLKIKRQSSSI